MGFIAALLAWGRVPRSDRGVVWAEDGAEFLIVYLNDPGLHLLQNYAGYLHAVPRLLAWTIAGLLPATWFAVAVSAASCAVAGLLAALVHRCTAQYVAHPSTRVVLGLLTVLGPGAATEVLGNTANLHWLFLWALPWILLHRPTTWWGSAGLAAVVLLGALTEIQVVVLVPLVLLMRTRRSLPLAGALLLGLALQLWTTLSVPRPAGTFGFAPPSPLALVEGWLVGPLLGSGLGRWPVQGELVAAAGWAPVVLLAVVLLAATAPALVLGPPRARVAAGTALVLSVVVFVAALVINPDPRYYYDQFDDGLWKNYTSPRYAVAASMFLLAAIVLGLDALASRRRDRGRPAGLVGAAAVVVVLAIATNAWPTTTARTGMPDFADEISAARDRCFSTGTAMVRANLAPDGWYVGIRCPVLAAWMR